MSKVILTSEHVSIMGNTVTVVPDITVNRNNKLVVTVYDVMSRDKIEIARVETTTHKLKQFGNKVIFGLSDTLPVIIGVKIMLPTLNIKTSVELGTGASDLDIVSGAMEEIALEINNEEDDTMIETDNTCVDASNPIATKGVDYYNTGGLEAATIMDMIRVPNGLSNAQTHSLLNIIKRLRRLGLKGSTTVDADIEKISQELNHVVNGSYR